jgi:hypothetical protein
MRAPFFNLEDEDTPAFQTASKNSQFFLNLRGGPLKPQSHVAEQLRQRQFQGSRNLFDVDERNVPLTAFDAANVCAVQFAQIGESLLGHPQLVPLLPDGSSEPDANVVHLPLRVIFEPHGLCVHGL